jgi:hypothetical protein
MADLERLKSDIAKIAGRPKGVTADEIARIVKQLGRCGYPVNTRRGKESIVHRVGTQIFSVCDHNPGSRFVKACYVTAFLRAMASLGLYDE